MTDWLTTNHRHRNYRLTFSSAASNKRRHSCPRHRGFDNSGTKAVWGAWLGTSQKISQYHFSSPEFHNPYSVGKLSSLDAEICSFSLIGQKVKNYHFFYFLPNRKISLDWALWCTSRGIDNFSLSQLFGPYGNGKLSISGVKICNFQQDRT